MRPAGLGWVLIAVFLMAGISVTAVKSAGFDNAVLIVSASSLLFGLICVFARPRP